jgi:Flp pilus assembly protein TadB
MRELVFTQQLRTSFPEARESLTIRRDPQKALSTLSPFTQQLVRAHIPFSPTVYVALCVTTGFGLFATGLLVGPFFAVFIGITVCYELLFAFPRERAFYRAQKAARQLPLLLETLGHQVQSGLSFESSLAKSLAHVPSGELAEQVGELIHKVERGGNLHEGLEELCDLCRLPDFRLFTQVVKLFGRGGVLNGDAFVELALFLRKYRESLSQLQRRARVQRVCFLLFTVMLIASAVLSAYLVPVVFAPPASVGLGLVRELGACAVVSMLLVAMRVTSAFSFEGHEQL